MKCDNCGNETAQRLRYSAAAGMKCDDCGRLTSGVGCPDVYFRQPYLDPNLAHPDRPHEVAQGGVWVTSRRHKAALLAEQNLVERGDKRRGARNEDKILERRVREQL